MRAGLGRHQCRHLVLDVDRNSFLVMRKHLYIAVRPVKGKDLAQYVGITEQNLSLLRTGKVKGLRFSTLEKISEFLDCQPGDIIEYVSG